MLYRGYEIKRYETLGDGRLYYEAWKDGVLWVFADDGDVLKNAIDGMFKKGVR